MRTTIPLTRLTILPHSRDTKVPGTPMRYRSVLPEILQALHRPFACGPIPASCRGLTLAVTRETMKFIEHRQSPSQPRGRIARSDTCIPCPSHRFAGNTASPRESRYAEQRPVHCRNSSARQTEQSRPAGGGPGFSRDGRHVSGYGPGSGRAVRAVRGRGGRLRAALWRLRDALPGSTGNGFVSGALFPLVASRAVCVGRIYSGLWRNYG